jgi:SAM-dependent methyltransferase
VSSGSEPPALTDGAIPSPNIWGSPQVYEIENRAVDRAGAIFALIGSLAPWTGRDVLDIGCGTGFHLPVFARSARSVTGVEPHADLAAIARRRTRRLDQVSVLQAGAADLPLPDASMDVMHARWAYFFGPGCEPGLAELDRVMRPGGHAFVIDNDDTRSTFGSWLRLGYPERETAELVGFWTGHGWRAHPVDMAWTFDSREDLEAVVRIEFPPLAAAEILASHEGTEVDYAVTVWSREY